MIVHPESNYFKSDTQHCCQLTLSKIVVKCLKLESTLKLPLSHSQMFVIK